MTAQPLEEGELPIIEGCISLTVDGRELLGPRLWDDVDCLWAYLVDHVAMALDDEAITTFFPDQDIPIEVAPAGDGRLRFGVGRPGDDFRSEVVIDAQSFAHAVADGAEAFFIRTKAVYPSYNTAWIDGKIARLRAA